MAADAHEFLDHPGAPGALGALMHEYVRAAHDFCRVYEGLALAAFTRESRESDGTPNSIQRIGRHIVYAGHRYAYYIAEARGLAAVDPVLDELMPATPAAFRPLLATAVRATEASLAGLHAAPAGTIDGVGGVAATRPSAE